MKYLILIVSFLALSLGQLSAQERDELKVTDMYAFGYATSLNDSIVYLTEISNMPVVTIKKKTGFLVNRASYTAQLKEHFKKMGINHPTCAIIFDRNKKKINSKFVGMMKKFQQKKRYFVKTISAEEFTFKELDTSSEE